MWSRETTLSLKVFVTLMLSIHRPVHACQQKCYGFLNFTSELLLFLFLSPTFGEQVELPADQLQSPAHPLLGASFLL